MTLASWLRKPTPRRGGGMAAAPAVTKESVSQCTGFRGRVRRGSAVQWPVQWPVHLPIQWPVQWPNTKASTLALARTIASTVAGTVASTMAGTMASAVASTVTSVGASTEHNILKTVYCQQKTTSYVLPPQTSPACGSCRRSLRNYENQGKGLRKVMKQRKRTQ